MMELTIRKAKSLMHVLIYKIDCPFALIRVARSASSSLKSVALPSLYSPYTERGMRQRLVHTSRWVVSCIDLSQYSFVNRYHLQPVRSNSSTKFVLPE